MAQVGTLDFSRFIEERKRKRAGGQEGGGHAYAYVSDKNTRLAFDKMKPVELAVTAAVRFFKSVSRNQLLGNAVRVGPDQFPRVHKLVIQSAETLGIKPPTLYITNNPYMNAMTFGTNDDSFIIVHSALVDHFTDAELLNVIGHETGHIHNSHVVYLTALYYLRHMASIFLKWIVAPADLALSGWQRRAEITCDRAGLLCTKDLDAAMATIAKLALGSSKLYGEFNLDAFLNQYEEGKEGFGKLSELTASHPWLSKRMKALQIFAQSELYRRHAGLGSDGLTMEQVDEKVHEIIAVVG
jgi:Zn-dependent protease with chaperone function